MDFYLASKSPRRKQLLEEAGFDFAILLSNTPDSVNEDVLPNEAPEQYVRRVTREKALWGRNALKCENKHPAPVLAADTTVVLDGKIYGKPQSESEARNFLKEFSGRAHQVLTAVCVLDKQGAMHETVTKTLISFRPLSDKEIDDYIVSGEPFDKAGGYGIQGEAGKFIEKIEGSFTNVVGLPVEETGVLLKEAGIKPKIR